MQIVINVTDEQLKAVEGIVPDAQAWLQEAWDGKAHSCFKRIILQESSLNPDRMSVQERIDWIKDNNFQTRNQKDGK